MSGATISFDIGTTDVDAELGIEVWLDSNLLYRNSHVTLRCNFLHVIDNDDGEHQLRIVMFGKTSQHTKIDDQGNIVKDAWLTIENPAIDDIDVGQLFNEKCVYTHDFNGSQTEVVEKFYGIMGCNGTVILDFSTPIYMWLLENM